MIAIIEPRFINLHFNQWDFALMAAVTTLATVVAYVHNPRWKALIQVLPIPFTLTVLTLGQPVNASNAAGALLFLIYNHIVRILHYNLRVPIVLSIFLAVAAYSATGTLLAGVLPHDNSAFYLTCIVAVIITLALISTTADHDEPGHKCMLPVWMKVPSVLVIVVCLIIIKNHLLGFMTTFPMVGVFGSYESKRSLWTVCRQVQIFMLAMIPMQITCRLLHHAVGQGWALACGWIVFLTLIYLIPRVLSLIQSSAASEAALE